jgi:uncharacterized membrane protein YsdA (DUF1294 family)
MVHVVYSDGFRAQNVLAVFFMLGWARCDFHKKCARIHYAELVSMHMVGSVGHVVRSSASGHETSMQYFSCSGGPSTVSIKTAPGHVTLKLCFCIGWDLQVKWCIPELPGGSGAVSIKSALGHVTLNLCFCIWWDLWVT